MTVTSLRSAHPAQALGTEEERRELARILAALFERWALDTEVQMQLLGMSPNSRKQLPKYRAGESALPNSRDTLDRRSEEHTSELQSREKLVCRLLREKKKNKTKEPDSV